MKDKITRLLPIVGIVLAFTLSAVLVTGHKDFNTVYADGFYTGQTINNYLPFSAITFIPPSDNPNFERLSVPMPLTFGSDSSLSTYRTNSTNYINGEVRSVSYFESVEQFELYPDQFLRYIELGIDYGGIGGISFVASNFIWNDEILETLYLERFVLFSGYVGGAPIEYIPSISLHCWSPTSTNVDTYVFTLTLPSVTGEVEFGELLGPIRDFLHNSVNDSGSYLINDLRLSFAFNPNTYSSIGVQLPSITLPYDNTFLGDLFMNHIHSLVNFVDGEFDVLGGIVNSVNSCLQIHILPNLRIMDLLIICLAVPVAIWLAKLWLGG